MRGQQGDAWAPQTWLRINDDKHQFGYLGTIVTGDPDVFGRVYIASNGRGVIYGTPSRARLRTQGRTPVQIRGWLASSAG